MRGVGLPVSAMGVEYGWVFSTGAERERLFGVFREACENAVASNCGLMMSAIGPGEASSDEAVANMRRAGEIAGSFGLRLTVEYQYQHPMVRSLDILRDLIAAPGRRMSACCSTPITCSAAVAGGAASGGARRGDLLRPVQRRARRAAASLPPVDRLPPGKGVVGWTDLFRLLAEKGYDGYLSYEAPNPAHWQQPAGRGRDAGRRRDAQRARKGLSVVTSGARSERLASVWARMP